MYPVIKSVPTDGVPANQITDEQPVFIFNKKNEKMIGMIVRLWTNHTASVWSAYTNNLYQYNSVTKQEVIDKLLDGGYVLFVNEK